MFKLSENYEIDRKILKCLSEIYSDSDIYDIHQLKSLQ